MCVLRVCTLVLHYNGKQSTLRPGVVRSFWNATESTSPAMNLITSLHHRPHTPYTETPVKILILKQIYTETSEPSLEALGSAFAFLVVPAALELRRAGCGLDLEAYSC